MAFLNAMGPSSLTANFLKNNQLLKELRHDILSWFFFFFFFFFFFQRENFSFSVKEATKYLFCKIEKHQNWKNKPKRNEDG